MNPILETIRNIVRSNSDAIFKIKEDATINPKNPKWLEYIGRKKQVTLFLTMLHLHKGTTEYIPSHCNSKLLLREAKKRLAKLEEEVAKNA